MGFKFNISKRLKNSLGKGLLIGCVIGALAAGGTEVVERQSIRNELKQQVEEFNYHGFEGEKWFYLKGEKLAIMLHGEEFTYDGEKFVGEKLRAERIGDEIVDFYHQKYTYQQIVLEKQQEIGRESGVNWAPPR